MSDIIEVSCGIDGRESRDQSENLRPAGAQERAQRGAHLYVMQATDGRVKIGRSADPKQRRRYLQSAGGRKVAILLVLANRGNDELGILHALAAYRGFPNYPFDKAIC